MGFITMEAMFLRAVIMEFPFDALMNCCELQQLMQLQYSTFAPAQKKQNKKIYIDN